MAFRPCASCGKPFFGASEFTYVTWFRGEDRFAYRLAQCAPCAAELRNPVLEVAETRDPDGVWAVSELAAPQRLPAAPAPRRAAAG